MVVDTLIDRNPEPEWLEHLSVLELKAGDIIVVRMDGRISQDGLARLKASVAGVIRDVTGREHKVIVLEKVWKWECSGVREPIVFPKKMSPEDLKRFRDLWESQSRGLANAHRVVFIDLPPLRRLALNLRLWVARRRAARYA